MRTLIAIVALVLVACGNTPEAADSVRVVASFYPLAFVAERIAGPEADVRNLAPPGAEPHDLELAAGEIGVLQTASLALYLGGGFQPAVEKAVRDAGERAVDVRSVVRTEDDPHFWLDPVLMKDVADLVATKLAAIDGAGAAGYRDRAAALSSELDALHERFRAGLASCKRREIVTSHDAFGYLAARYGLRQIPIAGIDPEAEPSPARLAEVVRLVREHGVTTIFTETLVSPKIAETLADEAHVRTDVLDPVESIEAGSGDDYLKVMDRNLAALRSALDCP